MRMDCEETGHTVERGVAKRCVSGLIRVFFKLGEVVLVGREKLVFKISQFSNL